MKTPSSLHRCIHVIGAAVLALSFDWAGVSAAQAQIKKPNIPVIWGDDIGWQNVSPYGMGYTTLSIGRIGQEGIHFTDHYAQPSSKA